MLGKQTVTAVVMILCLSLNQSIAIGGDPDPSGREAQEYNQELIRVKAMEESFTSGPTNDLSKYEKFIDEIQNTWSQRNKEYYACLMLVACGPLGSGRFKGDRQQYELARKYALSALENPDAIPLTLELELTGHVMTLTIGPNAPKDEDFAECREKDVKVRLHAWKRLIDALDPNWDNESLSVHVPLPLGVSGGSGMSPKNIKDDALRTKYESDIKENKKKIQKHAEQYKLRLWLKTFPKRSENYIIQVYSHSPYNIEELKKSLSDYAVDEKTKKRILDAVIKNTREIQKE